ncbi:hypothetical protein [Shimia sp.]|uniref:hypothetical protein n=1 Tax=Shimia sp. TaxID=1954381 RepID=UPI003B8CC0A8
MRILVATVKRAPYLVFVLSGVTLAILFLIFELKLGLQQSLSGFGQQVATGCVLLVLLSYQWVLFAKRVTRNNNNAHQSLTIHRWVGVVTTLAFTAHAVRFGHVWMTGVSVVFFLIALTGVLNRTVLRYRQNWIYLVWMVCHIGLSAALVPLVGVHIWVALAYQ